MEEDAFSHKATHKPQNVIKTNQNFKQKSRKKHNLTQRGKKLHTQKGEQSTTVQGNQTVKTTEHSHNQGENIRSKRKKIFAAKHKKGANKTATQKDQS